MTIAPQTDLRGDFVLSGKRPQIGWIVRAKISGSSNCTSSKR